VRELLTRDTITVGFSVIFRLNGGEECIKFELNWRESRFGHERPDIADIHPSLFDVADLCKRVAKSGFHRLHETGTVVKSALRILIIFCLYLVHIHVYYYIVARKLRTYVILKRCWCNNIHLKKST